MLSAVALSSEKVFITYYYNNYLRALICTIEGTEITVGTDKQISNYITFSSTVRPTLSAVALSENKVFVTYDIQDTYSTITYTIYGTLCTINELNISYKQSIIYNITDKTFRNGYPSLTALSENKVFVAFNAKTNFLYRTNLYNRRNYYNKTVHRLIQELIAYMKHQ